MGRSRPKERRDARGCGPAAQGRSRLPPVEAVFAASLAVAIAAILVASLVAPSGGSPNSPQRAAIVDQLSLTQPNPGFAAAATDMLERAGYAVDYYPGEGVTVDFYRDLPQRGYRLLVMRVHSALIRYREAEQPADDAGLFTSEPYSQTRYVEEQEGRAVVRAFYREDSAGYFGIAPRFVESSMKGRFDGTLVIMMGCDGLTFTDLAEAFIQKGAAALVGWSKPVSASHTDAATLRLLEKLLVERLAVKDAVGQTAAEVGPDPAYGAELRVLERGG